MILYVTTWLQLRTDRRALTALEYGLIGSALIGTIMVGFRLLGNNLSTKFSGVGGSL